MSSPQDARATGAHPEYAPYWEAVDEGRLLIGRCRSCGEAHYYPRPFCPHCYASDVEWVASSGRGVIYAYSVLRRVKEPYAIAYVTLAEGLSVLTNIVDCDLDGLRIGMAVELTFGPTVGDQPVPLFRPSDEPKAETGPLQ